MRGHRRSRGGSVLRRQHCPDVLRRASSVSDDEERADDDADHVVEEAVAANADDELCAFLEDVHAVDFADGVAAVLEDLAVRVYEAREVMDADELPGGGPHALEVERVGVVIRIEAGQRVRDAAIIDAVFVALFVGHEARVEIHADLVCLHHADVRGQVAVDGLREVRRRDRAFGVEAGNVPKRMDTAVGAARAHDRDGISFLRQELSERALERALNRRHRAFRMRCCRLLDLPATVVRAVICDCELDSSHHLQNGSATKRDTTDRPR